MSKQLRFVCAQPATKYYVWQVEVMLNNFIETGINPNFIDIVCNIEDCVIPDEWSRLAETYAARFFFYEDTRKTKHYISSIRPNILKQHWEKHPYLKNDIIFYHDCDILFTKPISEWITDEMCMDDIWYGSDTRWYIAHSYIKGKGDDVIRKMCEIMGLNETLIEDNELNTIGAQYLMKNVDYDYWDNVETNSEKLFNEINEFNRQKKLIDPKYHELQIWCADMWAVLWGAWILGYSTNSHKNFDFSWATSTEEEYHNMNIMHNAGVTSPNDGLFYKPLYMNKYPYNENLNIKENTCSRMYWESVKKTAKKSCLI